MEYGKKKLQISPMIFGNTFIILQRGYFGMIFTRLDEFKRLLRSDIKVTLFREVFYSKTLTTKGKDFAKSFKKKYPSVYKLVKESKKRRPYFLG